MNLRLQVFIQSTVMKERALLNVWHKSCIRWKVSHPLHKMLRNINIWTERKPYKNYRHYDDDIWSTETDTATLSKQFREFLLSSGWMEFRRWLGFIA